MTAFKSKLVLLVVFVLLMPACGSKSQASQLPEPQAGSKALIIGMSGVTWRDLIDANSKVLQQVIDDAVITNVSVRVSNWASDAYASLGAGQRAHTNPSAGWAFNRSERIENGRAGDMYLRRTNSRPSGEVILPTIDQMVHANKGTAFDAKLGALASALEKKGKAAAVLGNADYSIGSLPSVLPNQETMQRRDAPDIGIHREVALAVMDPNGVVPLGNVSRQLLRPAQASPFGVANNETLLLEQFKRTWSSADLVAVELGDTYRADLYSVGLSNEEQKRNRVAAITRTADQLAALLSEVDLSRDLVVVIAATTPGGAQARGQLRPALLLGAGLTGAVGTSPSTRRIGLVTIPDLTATIARHLGLSDERFEAGHVVGMASKPSDPTALAEMNEKAVVQDLLRTPLAASFVALQLLILGAAAVFLMRRSRLPAGLVFGLLVMLSFPVATFTPSYGFWKLGPIASGLIVAAESVVIAAAAAVIARRKPTRAATLIIALTAFFFVVDIISGTPAQLDSVLGYTSVAAGRFYGLGNLGFAIFGAAAIILASSIADLRRTISAVAVLVVALGIIGLPQLGNDFGGTITMVVAIAVFVYVIYKKRSLPGRLIPIALLAGVLVILIFGAIDMARPPSQRSHIGDFLATAINDPSYVWLISQRKLGLAASLAISSRWGLAVPITVGMLIWVYRRKRSLLQERTALRAGLEALIVAAVIGSLVNDSGVAVAGMMLAVGVPWALLATAELETAVP